MHGEGVAASVSCSRLMWNVFYDVIQMLPLSDILSSGTQGNNCQAVLKWMIKAYLGKLVEFLIQRGDQIQPVKLPWVVTSRQSTKDVNGQWSTWDGGETVLFDDLGIKNFRSVLHRVTNQSQWGECKTIHVPLPVSTVFVLVVSKPFSRSDGCASEIGVEASGTCIAMKWRIFELKGTDWTKKQPTQRRSSGCHATSSCVTMGSASDNIYLYIFCVAGIVSHPTHKEWVLTCSYIDYLFWSHFWLTSESVGNEFGIRRAQKLNWGWSHRNRGFLLRNSQQSSMFCLPGNSIKLIFVHRINAKYAFVSLAFCTLPKMSCHCFSLIPLQKLYFHCFNWYTIVAEVKSKSGRG